MSLLLRNRQRDERVDRLQATLDRLLAEGERGRSNVRDKLDDLQQAQDEIRKADDK